MGITVPFPGGAFPLAHGNVDSDLEEYARVIKTLYQIEESFRRAKGECGLGDYQGRNWLGWYHHFALSMLSLRFTTEVVLFEKIR